MHDSEEHPHVATARLAIGFALLAGTLLCGPVAAQVERSGGGASAKLMQQYQQMATERTQLQAQNAQLKKDLDEAKKQLGIAQQRATTSKAGVDRGQAAIAAARAANETTQKSLDETKVKMQELVGRFRETIATLHGVETERSQLRQQLAESQTAFDRCAVSNYELYQVDNEVLDRYEHQGAFSYLGRAEPFTRIKRTRIENLVDEYRQRAEALRVKKASAAVGGAAANSATDGAAESKPPSAPRPTAAAPPTAAPLPVPSPAPNK